jgi:O-methyltransferase
MHADDLLAEYKPISDQVSAEQIRVILRELELTLDSHPTGAITEFGCYSGTTSLFIRRLLDARGESGSHPFHVYDSFEGLPKKTDHDNSPAGDQFQAGELRVSKKDFMREFQKAGLRPPVVHKRWFSHLDEGDVPEQICFAFLDGDFYESIRDSLEATLPYLLPHATLIVDDYAREALPGVARAIQEYLPKDWHTRIVVEHNMALIRT